MKKKGRGRRGMGERRRGLGEEIWEMDEEERKRMEKRGKEKGDGNKVEREKE